MFSRSRSRETLGGLDHNSGTVTRRVSEAVREFPRLRVLKLRGKSFNRAPERFVGAICAMGVDFADESWREARVGRVFVAPPHSDARFPPTLPK